jgi:hypothetical protein
MRHWAIPILAFAAITVWWLFPVLANVSSVIPGAGAGDNVTFVWNVWWMRYALAHPGLTFFFTPYLFHPLGADLTLHTHSALPTLVAAIWSSPIAGENVVIALHLFLNFLCAYALAHRFTRGVVPSVAAATIFGTSSFVCAHLNGHFNLIAAWTLPLVCLVALNALEKEARSEAPVLLRPSWEAASETPTRQRASWVRGVLLGGVLAAAAYTDYYLFVYAIVVSGLLLITPTVRFARHAKSEFATPAPWRRHLLVVLGALVALDLVVILSIRIITNDRIEIGPIHISIRSIRNPVTAAWLIALTAIGIAASSRVRVELNDTPLWRSSRAIVIAIATMSALLLPLVAHAVELGWSGNYVSQTYLWRSGPSGIDAATIVLGNPFHAIWGDRVRLIYDRFHIDVIESTAWIPLSALALAAAGIVLRRGSDQVRLWLLGAAFFSLSALGPWLMIFDRQTPLMLPGMFVRFVPIVANARIPGRAMVGVYLAVAVLSAIGLEAMIARGGRVRTLAWCLVVMLAIECVPARPPTYVADMPSEYSTLRGAQPRGAVCELPFGLRDGFGEIGAFDGAVLLHQTMHERPIVGGFVARLPPAVARTYETIPVLRSLLRLSSGGKVVDDDDALTPASASAALTKAGIAFVVLDARRASVDLANYVQSKLELRRLAEEDGRIFFAVK